MVERGQSTEQRELVKILSERLRDEDGCPGIVASYEEFMSSVWTFVARLLGNAGTRAVFARAVRLAAQDFPMLDTIQVGETKVDFTHLRDYLAKEDCSPTQVLDALLQLGIMILRTLSDLSGDTITVPLLHKLEES